MSSCFVYLKLQQAISLFSGILSLITSQFLESIILSTSNYYIILINRHQKLLYYYQSIKISFDTFNMQVVKQIDSKLAKSLPFYSNISAYAVEHCKAQYDAISNLYEYSANRVNKMTKTSKQLKKDLIWMISQSTDDFLQYLEQKLEIECSEADEKNRMKRVMNICKELKNKKIVLYINRFITFNKDLYSKGKLIGEKYFIPMYITVKATVIVSKQVLMQNFQERMVQLRMTFKSSKDTITMFWSGEFKQQKMIQKMKEKFGSLKQLTVNYVQKGLEIKVSKKDLAQNYNHIMNMLAGILKDVSNKSFEQLKQTKTKSVNLYNSVLNRIRQKQVEIKSKMQKQKLIQSLNTTTQEKKLLKQEKVVPNNQSKSSLKQN